MADRKRTLRLAGGAVALAAAGAMVLGGVLRTHEVCIQGADELAREFELPRPPYEEISDAQLVIDATFSGVLRRGANLYSTYDRSEPAGRRACPT